MSLLGLAPLLHRGAIVYLAKLTDWPLSDFTPVLATPSIHGLIRAFASTDSMTPGPAAAHRNFRPAVARGEDREPRERRIPPAQGVSMTRGYKG
jgi:hypothetical protein